MVATWALIPVNTLSKSKSRLASVLSPAGREAFTLETLERTLALLDETPGIEATVVISPDHLVRRTAARNGAAVLPDMGHGLNAALEEATAWAQAEDAGSILILASDLPMLDNRDLDELLAPPASVPYVAIAPCKHDSGTNAMAVQPPGVFHYTFGAQSFASHCRAAHEAGALVRIVRSATLGFDVDTPLDYAALRRRLQKA